MTSFPLDSIRISAAKAPYVGRFAPSPSGELHFGSMVAALGSYLQAKANHGLWLVRIEDIDPPREVAGAATQILNTLEQFGLNWDGDVVYQSQRQTVYRQTLDWLFQNQQSYLCQCSRKQINQNAQTPGIYQRTCRSLNILPNGEKPCAIRFKNDSPVVSFTDLLQGEVSQAMPHGFADDFIIHRKDGLFAYQLAVVIDDIGQGITQIVRGSDLLPTTLHQMTLYKAFGQQPISYVHLPVASTEKGMKLSKQNHAKAVSKHKVADTLIELLIFLGFEQATELKGENRDTILDWAINHWCLSKISPVKEKLL